MAPGLPDRVDCAQLADEAALLERVYPLGELPRLHDILADAHGWLRARFAFGNVGEGRAGVTVEVEAAPNLVCQRCLQGFAFAVAGRSEIEFSSGTGAAAPDAQREDYVTVGGRVSLRELAEEELLLALPIVPLHPPQHCARTAALDAAAGISDAHERRSRPFSVLQDLLKKT
jgi:uncharacterized protein